jgi:hypothetical protein
MPACALVFEGVKVKGFLYFFGLGISRLEPADKSYWALLVVPAFSLATSRPIIARD